MCGTVEVSGELCWILMHQTVELLQSELKQHSGGSAGEHSSVHTEPLNPQLFE